MIASLGPHGIPRKHLRRQSKKAGPTSCSDPVLYCAFTVLLMLFNTLTATSAFLKAVESCAALGQPFQKDTKEDPHRKSR